MKTIAILTDFSKRAENAGNYALYLAQSLHANLILYDAFVVASDSPMAAQVAWPMEDYDTLRQDSENELQTFAKKLREKLGLQKSGLFKPLISCQCHNGDLSGDLEKLLAKKYLVLLVMASHDDSMSNLFLRNHVHELLDTTTLPVLIIRDQYPFQTISNIAFATDLELADIDVIRGVSVLAKPTKAQITLIHIAPANKNDGQVKEFMAEVFRKVDYPLIRYQKMTGSDIMDEITGLDDSHTYDMLVMVHHHKDFWEKLFNQSDTQTAASHVSLPLLVYPFPTRSLPVF
jgi:nucleotide-binding universal stress UspA family protein